MSIRHFASASERTSLVAASCEIAQSTARFGQWGLLAWNDIRLRYRRTTLGPLWITSGISATVFSVGLLYAVIFGNDASRYLPYFATGLIAWALIGSTLDEGCVAYLGAAGIIKAVPVAPVVHVLRLMARQYIMLAHNLLLVAVLWLLFPWKLSWACLLVVPGLAVNGLVLLGGVLTLSIVAARFRDVKLIISTVLQLLFLLTPVMWETKSLKGTTALYIADLNPFFHLIEVVRRPLLGEAPAEVSWLFDIIAAAVSMAVGLYFYARYRDRVAFWV